MGGIIHFSPTFSFVEQPKLGFRKPVSSLRDDHRHFASQKLCLRSTISSKASGPSGASRSLGRNQRRRDLPPARPKRTLAGQNDESIGENSSNSAKSNQQEVISIFKRIQTSISKGGYGSTMEKKKEKTESFLDVLSLSRNRREDVRETKEPNRNFMQLSIDQKRTRPASKFIKRSPIPFPSSPRTRIPEPKSEGKLKEKIGKKEESLVVERLKLSELKEAAKARGMKGYSKLKKTELLELLRPL